MREKFKATMSTNKLGEREHHVREFNPTCDNKQERCMGVQKK